MTQHGLRIARAATMWGLRGILYGAVFVPLVGIVSSGVSTIPDANSFENMLLALGVGLVVFQFLGVVVVALGVFWAMFALPILSRSWLRRTAVGRKRTVAAAIVGVLSGTVAAVATPTALKEPLYYISSAFVGAVASPFIAWVFKWDSKAVNVVATSG